MISSVYICGAFVGPVADVSAFVSVNVGEEGGGDNEEAARLAFVTFAAFGLFYLGGVQYFLYVPVFSRLFPNAAAYAAAPVAAKLKDVAGTRNMIMQVVLDQFVHHPLLYFPVFYSLKEVVNGGTVGGGLSKYANNYAEDLPALWKLWLPATIINFSVMPMHLRIPWVASTSLIWTCIISSMRGSNDVETDPNEAMNALGGNAGRPLQALYDLGIAAKVRLAHHTSPELASLSVSAHAHPFAAPRTQLCHTVLSQQPRPALPLSPRHP